MRGWDGNFFDGGFPRFDVLEEDAVDVLLRTSLENLVVDDVLITKRR